MSARTPDSIFYDGERYAILRVSPYDGLFNPQQFGITPKMLHTGARRGFVCCYTVMDETLLLSSLEIRAKDGLYPAINDSIPSFPHIEFDDADQREFFHTQIQTKDTSGRLVWRFDDRAIYTEIEAPVAYTGTLRIAQDADWKYCRSVIFGLDDWAYQKVLDLKFMDGCVETVTDLSDEMARIRAQQPTGEEYRNSNPG
jgi:hypothetical protein